MIWRPRIRRAPRSLHPAMRERIQLRRTVTTLAGAWLCLCWVGCNNQDGPGTPRDLSDRERQVITVARRAVAQHEDWLDRAEFRIERSRSLWHVTAWRVEHPEAKGNNRYVPWGSRRILIDDQDNVVEYGKGR